MVLGKEKLTNEHRTFEAIFVGLVERSDMVIVMDPRNGAQKVSTFKRLSEAQSKDGGMVMALCGLPWRPKPDEPASNEVPVRVPAGSKVPQRNLPGVPGLRAPDVESRRVHIREENDFKTYGYTDPRQDRRPRAAAMNVDSVSKKRHKQKWKAEKG